MVSNSIIHLDHELSKVMRCIPSFIDDWDGVTIVKLERINTFLKEHQILLEEGLHEDKKEGCLCLENVRDIYFNLRKYSKWLFVCQSRFNEDKASNIDAVRKKAELAELIYICIETQWLAYIRIFYPSIIQEVTRHSNLLTAREQHCNMKEQMARETDTEQIYSIFLGSYNEQEKHVHILKSVLDGKKGKKVAAYEQAAEQLGWINAPIPYDLLKSYFGITGSASAVANFYNSSVKDQLTDNEIDVAKAELLRHV